ncbi:hypothetical protein JCM19240_5841 [Vibrio maritimus]|uniref:Uncharacterized protein n=1 Tax=Vibrio maritimus TaxID=990268 RepID=A0A090SXA8_9VIBR|nr:hypothetical protein JCM19240_5841 [Vibrio maritimus]
MFENVLLISRDIKGLVDDLCTLKPYWALPATLLHRNR